MARTPQDVTEAELAVLQALWEQGPSTRRRLTDVLYPGSAATQYTTVQKLLERLETKGLVTHSRRPEGLTFAATVDRDGLIGRRLLNVAEKLCGGSLTPLLMNLVRARPLSVQELQELQNLIRDARREARRQGDGR